MLFVLGGLEYDGGEYPGVDCRYSSKSYAPNKLSNSGFLYSTAGLGLQGTFLPRPRGSLGVICF
jgi:hypothetical protein